MTAVYQWLNYWMSQFECNSHQQLYKILQVIAITKLGLDGVPFSLLDLAHPPSVHAIREIRAFLMQCHKAASGNNSDDDAIKLIEYLKDNPPEESYENPYVSDSQPTEAAEILEMTKRIVDTPWKVYTLVEYVTNQIPFIFCRLTIRHIWIFIALLRRIIFQIFNKLDCIII